MNAIFDHEKFEVELQIGLKPKVASDGGETGLPLRASYPLSKHSLEFGR
jgi:hypothetical protein